MTPLVWVRVKQNKTKQKAYETWPCFLLDSLPRSSCPNDFMDSVASLKSTQLITQLTLHATRFLVEEEMFPVHWHWGRHSRFWRQLTQKSWRVIIAKGHTNIRILLLFHECSYLQRKTDRLLILIGPADYFSHTWEEIQDSGTRFNVCYLYFLRY